MPSSRQDLRPILVVDEDEGRLAQIGGRLSHAGYRVVPYRALPLAGDALACQNPQAIVSAATGAADRALRRCVRCAAELAKVPLVFLTDPDAPDDLDEAGPSEVRVARTEELGPAIEALRALGVAPGRRTDDPTEAGLSTVERLRRRTLAAEAKYQTLFEAAADGIALLTPDGVVLEANARAAAILGLRPDQMVGRHVRDFAPPGSEQANVDLFDRLVAAGRTDTDATAWARRADGGRRRVDFSLTRVNLDCESTVMVIGRDTTDQKELEARVLRAQKMEAIGQLTGGVAHDFNNVLGAIVTYGELLRETFSEHDPRRDDVAEILAAAARAAALTRQLLAFAGRQVLEPQVAMLGDCVRGIERMLRRLLGDHIALHTEAPADLGAVRVDVGQIEQVLVNLAVNARDAMPDGGELTISLDDVDLAGDEAERAELPPGGYVRIRVADTGSGMDDPTVERIFEPFFTTKGPDRGTGLGLATCLGIVRQSGGMIDVASAPGCGTVFTILLPRADGVVAPRRSGASLLPVGSAPRGRETVLLVEDDPHLRRALARMISGLGYATVPASDGNEALALATTLREVVDVIVSDVELPGLRGPTLVAALRESIGLATPVLFISAHADPGIGAPGDRGSNVSFLQKPFTLESLATRLHALIEQR